MSTVAGFSVELSPILNQGYVDAQFDDIARATTEQDSLLAVHANKVINELQNIGQELAQLPPGEFNEHGLYVEGRGERAWYRLAQYGETALVEVRGIDNATGVRTLCASGSFTTNEGGVWRLQDQASCSVPLMNGARVGYNIRKFGRDVAVERAHIPIEVARKHLDLSGRLLFSLMLNVSGERSRGLPTYPVR